MELFWILLLVLQINSASSRRSETVSIPGSLCGGVLRDISAADIRSSHYPGQPSCTVTMDAGKDSYSSDRKFMIIFDTVSIKDCGVSLALYNSEEMRNSGNLMARFTCNSDIPGTLLTSSRYLTLHFENSRRQRGYSFRITVTSYSERACGDFSCSDGYCIDEDLICDKINHCQDGSDETPYFPADCSYWTHVSTTAYYVFRFGVGAIVGLVATVTISCVVVTVIFLLWYRRKVNEYRQLELSEPAYSLHAYPPSDDSPVSETPPSMYPVPGCATGQPTYSGDHVADYGSTANIPLMEETSFNGCKV